VAGSELKPDVHNAASKPYTAQWPWYLAVVLVVGAVEPLVGSVRHGSEPYVGHWLAYALGILAAAAAALPIFAVVNWVIRREQSKQSDGIATMTYRPAALPGLVFLGAILKDFPAAFTEIATYGFLGGFVFLLAITVIIQKRRVHAWSWSFAILVGFGIALLALLAAGILSVASGQRP
jgi:hypothetical protein